jgi:protein-disulfide isomerase
MTENNSNPYLIPGAIVVAGLFIAGALFFAQGGSPNAQTASISGSVGDSSTQQQPQTPPPVNADGIKPVTAQDHIKGDPNAPVKIVEFSDTECPFCKRFHSTMQQAVQEYDGQVAWVYRHFPLDQLHSKARREAAAVELAGELGGNDKFWEYLDRVFEITPANDGLDLNLLPQIAQDIGLPRQPFEDLVTANDIRGGKFADHIEADYQDAAASGGRGTPYSVVIAPNGKTFPLSGAQPYASVKSIIELALQEK